MGFRKFMISFIALVTITIIILFLCLVGMGFEVLKVFLEFIVFASIIGFGTSIAIRLGDRVKKADSKEISREDDVLLEAVAFSQSVLFVLLSLMQSEDRIREALLYGTVLTTLAFYTLRAWAKIKDSPKYRYYSMIAFAFLSGNMVTSVLKLYFNIPDELIIKMGMVYVAVAYSLARIAEKVFKKRYGYKGSRLRES